MNVCHAPEPIRVLAAAAGASTALSASATGFADSRLPSIGGTWLPASLPFRRRNAAVAIDGGLISGGLDIHGRFDLFEAFDTRTGTWTTLPNLPEPRDHMGLTVADGQIYPRRRPSAVPDVRPPWRYDPANGRWTALAPMPAAGSMHRSRSATRSMSSVGWVRTQPRASGVRHPERRVAHRSRAAADGT